MAGKKKDGVVTVSTMRVAALAPLVLPSSMERQSPFSLLRDGEARHTARTGSQERRAVREIAQLQVLTYFKAVPTIHTTSLR